jgi:hypothetical protein
VLDKHTFCAEGYIVILYMEYECIQYGGISFTGYIDSQVVGLKRIISVEGISFIFKF